MRGEMLGVKSFISSIVTTLVVIVASMVASFNDRDALRTLALPFTISGWR